MHVQDGSDAHELLCSSVLYSSFSFPSKPYMLLHPPGSSMAADKETFFFLFFFFCGTGGPVASRICTLSKTDVVRQ